ncbi:MAG: hypothetical protein ACTSUF_10360 [Candidatus Heimdallarchaeaceae archaeon]
MTPERKGIWKDIIGVTDIKEADYCVIIDDTKQDIPWQKAIYINAHPFFENYSGYVDMSNKKCFAKLDAKYDFGFGEWWLEYDYDYLSKLEKPEKIKDICCIMSNTSGGFGKEMRKKFVLDFKNKYGLNLYGRLEGFQELGEGLNGDYWYGKEPVLEIHKHSIEFDMGITSNYFSERVFDSLLMWCKPFYWGSNNLERYLPKESFSYIDISKNGEDIIENIGKIDYNAIATARDLLLNKYQLWARIYDIIHNNPLY